MSIVKYKSGDAWVSVATSGAIATRTTYGYVKLASSEDIAEGTNDSAVVTAKQFKDFADGNFVHLTGNETISGVKTFSGAIKSTIKDSTVPNNAFSVSMAQESADDGGWADLIGLYDTTNNSRCATIRAFNTTTKHGIILAANNFNSGAPSGIEVSYNTDNQLSILCPSPSASNSTSATNITTVGWVNDPTKSTNVVHRTGDETIGGTKTFSNTIQGTAYRAYWGDLAEYYLTDNEYPKGTLIQFGGEKEITIAKNKVNAVITSDPGFILNSEQKDSQAIALIGRVPVRVIGKVNKFDKIALSYIDGVGCVNNDSENPIGIALESKDDSDEGLIICSVKINL